MRATITLDDSDLRAGVDSLKAKFPNAVRRALERTGVTVKNVMAKLIQEDTALSSARIKREVKVNRVGSYNLQIEARGNRIPLIDFSARGPEPSRGKGRGVSYKLPGGRSRDPHAFIVTMPSGHRGVFRRTGQGRLPVVQLHGPSMMNVFAKHLGAGESAAREALAKNLRHEIEFAASRR